MIIKRFLLIFTLLLILFSGCSNNKIANNDTEKELFMNFNKVYHEEFYSPLQKLSSFCIQNDIYHNQHVYESGFNAAFDVFSRLKRQFKTPQEPYDFIYLNLDKQIKGIEKLTTIINSAEFKWKKDFLEYLNNENAKAKESFNELNKYNPNNFPDFSEPKVSENFQYQPMIDSYNALVKICSSANLRAEDSKWNEKKTYEIQKENDWTKVERVE
ncbi:MAG: hypothetical protein AB1782_04430 [Cyanobacteriota bacterium]